LHPQTNESDPAPAGTKSFVPSVPAEGEEAEEEEEEEAGGDSTELRSATIPDDGSPFHTSNQAAFDSGVGAKFQNSASIDAAASSFAAARGFGVEWAVDSAAAASAAADPGSDGAFFCLTERERCTVSKESLLLRTRTGRTIRNEKLDF
jgi:hypothetical protein